VTLPRSYAGEKIGWQGLLLSVQSRIRLTRWFDQCSHTYLGYALKVGGRVGGDAREFFIGIGQGVHTKHQGSTFPVRWLVASVIDQNPRILKRPPAMVVSSTILDGY
jgi:hypothetical protein